MLELSGQAIELAAKNGLPVTYVTEDTTRSRPEVLSALFDNAIEHGATRLCLCDTVGHATPDGIRTLIGWTQQASCADRGVTNVAIDWHGHNDRGLGVTNCDLRARVRRRSRARHDPRRRRARGQRGAGPDPREPEAARRARRSRPHPPHRAVHQGLARRARCPSPTTTPSSGRMPFVRPRACTRPPSSRRKKRATLSWRTASTPGCPRVCSVASRRSRSGHMSGESNVVYWLKKRGIDTISAVGCRHLRRGQGHRPHPQREPRFVSIVTQHQGATAP